MIQSIEPRDFSFAYELPKDPEKLTPFVNNLMEGYKFVLVMGISGTGKSTLLKHYTGFPNWTYTLWNRDTIFNMLWNDGSRDEEFYKKIDKFESDAFPDLILKSYHQVIVESWGRLPNIRQRYLNYCPKGIGRTLCIVMDGPIELIIERNIKMGNHLKFNKSEIDLKYHLLEKYNTIVWPRFSEGWTDICFINSFGIEGRKHLQARLV